MTRADWLATAAEDGLVSAETAIELMQEAGLTRQEAEHKLTHHETPEQHLIWSMP